MEVMAWGNGSFSVGLMLREVEYGWEKKNGYLCLRSKRGVQHVILSTAPGVFVEVLDKDGAVVESGGDGGHMYVEVVRAGRWLRYKDLPPPNLTKAQINRQRKKVTRYLVSDKPFNLSLPRTLDGVLKWIGGKRTEIPAKYRKSAELRFDTTTKYGETYEHIEITYTEPETDAEVIGRLQVEMERQRLRDEEDRAKLRELQSKFSD